MQWMGMILHCKHFAWRVSVGRKNVHFEETLRCAALENLLTVGLGVPENADLELTWWQLSFNATKYVDKKQFSIAFIYTRRSCSGPDVNPDSASSLSYRALCVAWSCGCVFIAAVLNAFACYLDPEITVYLLFQDGLGRGGCRRSAALAVWRGTCGYSPVQKLPSPSGTIFL